MRNKTKVWLTIAALLVIVGCLMFVGVMTTLNWNFMELQTVDYETNVYEINEVFDSVFVNADTADIEIVLSDDGECRVECREEENAEHSVFVKDGQLTVELIDKSPLYDFIGHIGLSFEASKITVYLPEADYCLLDTLKIKTSTGHVRVENIAVGTLDLTASTGAINVSDVICDGAVNVVVSTGKIKLDDIRCKSVTSSGTTGDIVLNNVIAEERFYIERNTGDVKFHECDAAEIFVKTNTGDVRGSLLGDKVFFAQSGTGKVDVPKTLIGGKCEIYTDTGDIKILI